MTDKRNETLDERIQRLAVEHLDACFDAMYEEGEELTESPAIAPFCGCATCVVREVLSVTYNELYTAAKLEAAIGRA